MAFRKLSSWTQSIPKSIIAGRTMNPIRRIVDMMHVTPNPAKPVIPLSIGDPTIYGNFKVPEFATEDVCAAVKSLSHNGYPHACGTKETRTAVAEWKSEESLFPVTEDDVILTCGCSQAIDMCFAVLANPGENNILVPRPGFSLYRTLLTSKGIEARDYNLLPDKNWECDLSHMESLIDDRTSAILINNPSNPCGSNFSKTHIEEIVSIAEKHQLPIIADEIYEHMAFHGNTYTSFSSVSKSVPILHVGGIAKRFMVPGWRLGWIVLNDRNGLLKDIRSGLHDLSTLTLGPASIVQSVVPSLLQKTSNEYFDQVKFLLEENANIIHQHLSNATGLHVIEPEAAMYVMVGIDTKKLHVEDDVEFSRKLFQEESVFVLPGQVFQMPNYFRIVITSPPKQLQEACQRISDFCDKHSS